MKYFVPFDFTEVTRKALSYAIEIANITDGRVQLVHFVDSKKEVKEATAKLQNEIGANFNASDDMIDHYVLVGSPIKEIGQTAEEMEASFVIMGSHGAKGMQKIFGSNALKVVSNSSIPFLITQENQKGKGIKNIVMPFSFAKESIQIIEFAASLGATFDAKIHLVGYRDKDSWLARDMKTNEVVVRRHLAETDVDYELAAIPAGSDYESELLKYAKGIDADLIAAAYFSLGIKDVFTKFVQKMLENELGIPVLTVNAEEMVADSGQFFF